MSRGIRKEWTLAGENILVEGELVVTDWCPAFYEVFLKVRGLVKIRLHALLAMLVVQAKSVALQNPTIV